MSEAISKQSSAIISSITGSANKNETQIEYKELLLKKRKSVSSDQEYLDSLLNNIAFLAEMNKAIQNYLETWFSIKDVVSSQKAEGIYMREKEKVKARIPSIVSDYAKNIVKPNRSIKENTESAEGSYSLASLVNNIMINVMMAYTTHRNDFIIFSTNPQLSKDTIFNNAVAIAGLLLGEMTFVKK